MADAGLVAIAIDLKEEPEYLKFHFQVAEK
jgi:hypothetical protein